MENLVLRRTETVELPDDPQFSPEEMQIIKLLFLRKVNIGVCSRINAILAQVQESLDGIDGIDELIEVQNRVRTTSYTELEKTAKCLGISNERFTKQL